MSADSGADAAVPPMFARVFRFAREHPYMVGLLVSCTIGGAAFAVVMPMGEVSLVRRVFGGAVGGFYFGLFPLGYRRLE